MLRLTGAALVVAASVGCAPYGDPCEQAADHVAACTGRPVIASTCSAEEAAAAEELLEKDCASITDPGKADVFCSWYLRWTGLCDEPLASGLENASYIAHLKETYAESSYPCHSGAAMVVEHDESGFHLTIGDFSFSLTTSLTDEILYFTEQGRTYQVSSNGNDVILWVSPENASEFTVFDDSKHDILGVKKADCILDPNTLR